MVGRAGPELSNLWYPARARRERVAPSSARIGPVVFFCEDWLRSFPAFVAGPDRPGSPGDGDDDPEQELNHDERKEP